MKYLVLIPARGGSKGIPGKNIKPLNGKPLIYYTIDAAKGITSNDDICVTTDSDDIINCVEAYGIKVPFKRPLELATDQANSTDVMLHAINFYEQMGKEFDTIIYLQPTSPFRNTQHILDAIALFSNQLDMVVSVFATKSNPYYVLFEEDGKGFLKKSKEGNFSTRQECPPVYEYNGAIYIINKERLKKVGFRNFTKVKKYVMDEIHSLDIDTPIDWLLAETVVHSGLINNNSFTV
jgi:CMP-N,N'-diacetyllegionaminic acid synthase